MAQEEYTHIFNRSVNDPENFWLEQAANIKWFQRPVQALSKDEDGFYRWFKGGKLNTSYLALDAHIEEGRGDQVALIYDSPVTQSTKKFTYNELRDQVSRLAGGMKRLGVEKGDTVIIYMPMIPQAVVSMLACARLGAVHSVVFGGFAPHELAIRIDDAKPKAIITATSGIEFDRILPYKPMVDEAVQLAEHKPEHVIVYNRRLGAIRPDAENDIDYATLMKIAEPTRCTEVDATDPLYILYTSGTTGKPKGIIRDNGGHAVAMHFSMKYVYGIHPREVFWAASDVGWVVGHSYIVYAPLIYGCPTVLFEGKPVKTPDASTFWRVISDHDVRVMFTAPTAIRAIKKEDPNGEFIKQFNMDGLKYLFLAGERCDVSTLEWAKEHLNVPVIDHWWQTESGWPIVANMMGLEQHFDIKPGSATKPVSGYNVQVLRQDGSRCDPNEEGYVAIKLPLPPGTLPNLWGDTERFYHGYLKTFDGYYFSGDGGYIDEDGYVFITGRVDDIINVAGHRLSTAEMEEVVDKHPDVAECCVVGIEDDLKGQIPLALTVLKAGSEVEHFQLQTEIVNDVRKEIGPVASLKRVLVAKRLPKTRSGKILRKIIRAIADGKEYKMPSTIDDPEILNEIKELFEEEKIGSFS
ncbi:MAG TPA: propionyl-CoA synthetase [Balneolaceae bacterium]|nr:propionyl-CoA synthetase [Balneolaceae bacterium]|tara:strand:+ start:5649 stop:7556 length:1908 start_codon:yes stop_codon:yes gene_type:complete